MSQTQAYTLSQLSRRITTLVAADAYLQNVWITAETMDVRVSGGHCYLELVEKDEQGRQLARARATIWATTFRMLAAKFYAETGQQFRSDLKVMVCVAVNYHAVYGLALNIVAINPAFTLGDAMQRRAKMIEQLRHEGIIDMNRTLVWPAVPQRIAIISAQGADGYGDFMHQLYSNASRLRFTTRLFTAVLQGERTGPSIIAALEEIAAEQDQWDCVVIIRGGGATSDLASFDHYDLAANIAQFPLPVIIGIGHERDITLLDYVANMRVKTPTAAAEWLIQRGEQALGNLQAIASAMLQAVTDRLSGCHRQLAFIEGALPAAATNALMRAQKRLEAAQMGVGSIADRRILPQLARLDSYASTLRQATTYAIDRARQKLDASETLLKALSPEATLRRGYTITRIAGHSARLADLREGEIVETVFAQGTILSQVKSISNGRERE